MFATPLMLSFVAEKMAFKIISTCWNFLLFKFMFRFDRFFLCQHFGKDLNEQSRRKVPQLPFKCTTKGRSRMIQYILHTIRCDYILYVTVIISMYYVLIYRFLDVSSQESPKKQPPFLRFRSAKTATTIGGNAEAL